MMKGRRFRRLIVGAVAVTAFNIPVQAQSVPLAVDIVFAEKTNNLLEVELTGTVEATRKVPVSFRSAGLLIEIAADVGDAVSQGDVLARIDPTQADAAQRTAAGKVAASLASLNRSELEHARTSDLVARGVATQSELDAAQATLLAALAAHDQSLAELAKAAQALADTEIHAPVDGIVTERDGEIGQIAAAGQPVLTVAEGGQRDVVFNGPNVPQLDLLMNAHVAIAPLEGAQAQYAATVTEISPIADMRTGTVLLRAQLVGSPTALDLGTAVSGSVAIPVAEAMTLPWSALATMESGPAVWVVDPESAAVSLRSIVVVRYTTSAFLVSSGIEEGEMVVTAGSERLYPGRVVEGTER